MKQRPYKKNNEVSALNILRQKAEQGDADAQCKLGLVYYNVRSADSLSLDELYNAIAAHKEAAKWFKQSAEQGYDKAQYNLGLCFFTAKALNKTL